MKNILVLMDLREDLRQELENTAPGNFFSYTSDSRATEEQFRDAEIILAAGGRPPDGLKACKKLKYIALRSVGYEQYLTPGLLPRKTVLTNAKGVYSKAVAEHGLALTLSLEKNLPYYRDNQNQGLWRAEGRTSSIADSTVLVVGLGDIGNYYAKLAKALGAYVIGVKRTPGTKPDTVDELITQDRLKETVGRADVIFNVLPGGPETYHLYDEELFSRMKSTALFINCGRGSSVDTQALCATLEGGGLRAAACDVFETEPLPPDSKLWKIRNLVITPHRAGFLLLPGTEEALVRLLAENLNAWIEGRELKNVVHRA